MGSYRGTVTRCRKFSMLNVDYMIKCGINGTIEVLRICDLSCDLIMSIALIVQVY